MKNNNNKTMVEYSTALGIIFGGALGVLVGLLTKYNLALTIVLGAGIGLIIGSSIYANSVKKN